MIRTIKKFEYFDPSTLEEAVFLLAKYKGEVKILAGGTDLLIEMKERKTTPEYLIDIKNISELDYIKYNEEEGFKIGALVTHSAVANSNIIQEKINILAEASLAVGSVQTRNKGTVVGNICNASPSADTAPALIALDAKFKLISAIGERIIDAEQFWKSAFKSVLKETELLAEIQIPNPSKCSGGSYLSLPKITAEDETLVGVGVLLEIDDLIHKTCIMARIGLGSVAPTPIRARQAEEFFKGKKIEDNICKQVAEIAANESSPRSRAEYRTEMIKVFVQRAINRALEKIK